MSRPTGQAAHWRCLHGRSQEFYHEHKHKELLKPMTKQQSGGFLSTAAGILRRGAPKFLPQQTRSCAPARREEQPSKAQEEPPGQENYSTQCWFFFFFSSPRLCYTGSARRGRDASRGHMHILRRVEPTASKRPGQKKIRH